jgi:hypothetical protein
MSERKDECIGNNGDAAARSQATLAGAQLPKDLYRHRVNG